MSEKAKEGHIWKKLPECICFHIPLGFVMPIPSANAGEHEANGVVLGDVGCFETLHGRFCCPLISHILVQQDSGTLDLGAAESQPNHTAGVTRLGVVTARQRHRVRAFGGITPHQTELLLQQTRFRAADIALILIPTKVKK